MESKGRLKQFLWGAAIAAVALLLLPLFDHFGKLELARPTGFALIAIIVAVKVCWELRGRVWFWITIIAIAALHAPLIMLTAQRLTKMPFGGMFLLGILDVLAILAVIGLFERPIGKKDAPAPRCDNL